MRGGKSTLTGIIFLETILDWISSLAWVKLNFLFSIMEWYYLENEVFIPVSEKEGVD